MEQDFPRGRGPTARSAAPTTTTTTGATHKQQHKQSKKRRSDEHVKSSSLSLSSDFLFGTSNSETQQRVKRSRKNSSSDKEAAADLAPLNVGGPSMLPVGGGGCSTPRIASVGKNKKGGSNINNNNRNPMNQIWIEPLSFTKLHPGFKLLATVKEVHQELAIFSLPNLWTAYALRETTNPPLDQQIAVRQVLSVVVVKVVSETVPGGGAPKRRIQVTVAPEKCNPVALMPNATVRGRVRSIEDHGLLVDLGLKRRGFLPFTEIEGNYSTSSDQHEDDNSDDYQHDKRILNVHRLIDCVVSTTNHNTSATIIPLKLPNHQHMAQLPLDLQQPVTLTELQPGTLIPRVTVEHALRNGLAVRWGPFRGAIELPHLGAYWLASNSNSSGINKHGASDQHNNDDGWKAFFQQHCTSFPARILAVDPVQKIIRLTRLPHLMRLQAPPDDHLPPTGAIIENCTVVRLDPGVGALLALPLPPEKEFNVDDSKDDGGDDKVSQPAKEAPWFKPSSKDPAYTQASRVKAVYVHISKALDPPSDDQRGDGKRNNKQHHSDSKGGSGGGGVSETQFAKQFAVGSQNHTVRILSTENWMEGVASGATAPSIVHAHVLTHADLAPGRVYKQVPVTAVASSGNNNNNSSSNSSVLVDFGLGIRGLIPSVHLFDQNSNNNNTGNEFRHQMRKVKYSIGAKVDVRVLTVDARTKKCLLTAKKTLVKAPDDEIITSYDAIQLGQVAVGYVSKVDREGLSVTFFNNVFGRITARSLVTELGVESPEENYSLGDVVRCRVIDLKKKKRDDNRRKSSKSQRWKPWQEDDDDEIEHDDHVAMDADDGDNNNNNNNNERSNPRQHYYYQLMLSLRLDGELMDTSLDDHTPRTKIKLNAGAILPLKSLRVKELVHGKTKGDVSSSHFVPGYAIVGIKSKYLVGEAEAATMPPFIECKLPYDQLLDHYDADDLESAKALDELALSMLTVGRKINRKGLVLYDPKKSNAEYSSGIGTLAILSVRPKLVETAEAQVQQQQQHASDDNEVTLPCPDTHLYAGQKVLGYVAQKDERHGAFIRFLDGMTGLVPKRGGGLHLPLFGTAVVQIVTVDDTVRPRRILLGLIPAEATDHAKKEEEAPKPAPLRIGDKIQKAQVRKFDFHRANLKILDEVLSEDRSIRVRIHCSMAQSKALSSAGQLSKGSLKQIITSCHPFYSWTTNKTTISDLEVVSVMREHNTWIVEVTNRTSKDEGLDHVFVAAADELYPGDRVSGIVSAVSPSNAGLWLEVSPTVSARVPGLELSQDVNVLNNLAKYYPVGSRLECVVLDKSIWDQRRVKYVGQRHNHHHHTSGDDKPDEAKATHGAPILSLLASAGKTTAELSKPRSGDLVVGRIDRTLPSGNAPDLMLNFRGGYIGRCCITELEEVDDWTNFPLGRARHPHLPKDVSSEAKDGDFLEVDRMDDADGEQSDIRSPEQDVPFAHGMFVQCRVLEDVPSKPLVEVSLRPSRIDGDCDDDEPPKTSEIVHAYVVATSKKGCFLRLGRQVEGRAILKELCDGFLPNPATSFPMGRLVVGKVTSIQPSKRQSRGFKLAVNVDMRESTLVEQAKGQVKYESIKIGDKYAGSVTRIEEYGVFVRIENSQVCGLVHKSECSDRYIDNLSSFYDPGDLVKLIVLKKDDEKKQLGFSMKASHFSRDDSVDDSSVGSVESSMKGEEADDCELGLDSDDDNFAFKLAMKMKETADGDDGDGDEDLRMVEASKETYSDGGGDDTSGSSPERGSDSSEGSDCEIDGRKERAVLDTNVGFDWNGGLTADRQQLQEVSEDSDSSDAAAADDGAQKSSHKSRKKQAQRRREEDEIAQRETALADGTADENPETAADFERLIAGDPNSSELWIKYMAFHLTLANISAAREVANRAFSRIQFRQENEKLNVWCALLTLELKYGSEETLAETLARACQHNNPKYVYLRMCEMMQKEGSSPDAVRKTDETFSSMCKKFKDKKKVWIAHMEYMLKNGRHEEAFALSKRALLSLKPHKHVETMSKFAQLVFEFGSADKARTIFDGLLFKFPKRLDLFFVYADKEVKHGDIDTARSLFAKVASPDDETLKLKLSDRQMKRFFKKWYSFEEAHGTEETQERVKEAARAFVERSAS